MSGKLHITILIKKDRDNLNGNIPIKITDGNCNLLLWSLWVKRLNLTESGTLYFVSDGENIKLEDIKEGKYDNEV